MKASLPAPGVVCAVLLPHAPVLVPTVGGARCTEVAATIEAMRCAARECLAAGPDCLVLVSPHSPRRRRAFGLWQGERLQGSLARFGAPRAKIDLPADHELREALALAAGRHALEVWAIPADDLDHGAVVPLWFFAEAAWQGPVVILSLNYPAAGGCAELGAAIAAAARESGRRVAVIASGDMSHRLLPGAPAGFHPGAREFDELFIAILRAGDDARLARLEPELLECAAEDVVESTVVAVAACAWQKQGREVLSYEGPFGVGYGVAMLHRPPPAAPGQEAAMARHRPGREQDCGEAGGRNLAALARQSVAAALAGDSAAAPEFRLDDPLARQRAGVFVTLRTRKGELRGCIGTVEAQGRNVLEETWRNARAAAFRDSRFDPVTARELPGLVFEVSLLEPAEDIEGPEQLEPRTYGVIVAGNSGRRGLLLPDVEGIETAQQQIEIARRKGGIGLLEPVTLQRFRVSKIEEGGKP
jgi:AmmeMemoRadiSam system protein A